MRKILALHIILKRLGVGYKDGTVAHKNEVVADYQQQPSALNTQIRSIFVLKTERDDFGILPTDAVPVYPPGAGGSFFLELFAVSLHAPDKRFAPSGLIVDLAPPVQYITLDDTRTGNPFLAGKF